MTKSADQERFENKILDRVDYYVSTGRPFPPDLAMTLAILKITPRQENS